MRPLVNQTGRSQPTLAKPAGSARTSETALNVARMAQFRLLTSLGMLAINPCRTHKLFFCDGADLTMALPNGTKPYDLILKPNGESDRQSIRHCQDGIYVETLQCAS